MPSSRHLTLLEPVHRAPLPKLDDLVPPDARRPGELHDQLEVSESTRALLSEASRDTNMVKSVVVTLLLEAGLAAEDLEAAGVATPCEVLDRAAGRDGELRQMASAEAAYLRSLTIGRTQRPDRLAITVPVRLLSRLRGRDIDALARTVTPEQARQWEVRALESGRTLGEWALYEALRG